MWEKKEIAGNQNCLLFPKCFTELPLRTLHLEIMYRANSLQDNPGVLRPPSPKKKASENTAGKGENAGNQHFLPFPQCFLFYQREKSSF